MLLVETFIRKSVIHGYGLFATDTISKGTVIWTYKNG